MNDDIIIADFDHVFVSINRFERKKHVQLAIEAIHRLASRYAPNRNPSMSSGSSKRTKEVRKTIDGAKTFEGINRIDSSSLDMSDAIEPKESIHDHDFVMVESSMDGMMSHDADDMVGRSIDSDQGSQPLAESMIIVPTQQTDEKSSDDEDEKDVPMGTPRLLLVIAGGYDERIQENQDYLKVKHGHIYPSLSISPLDSYILYL